MEPTATADAPAASTPSGPPQLPDVSGLLDGMPRQRRRDDGTSVAGRPASGEAPAAAAATCAGRLPPVPSTAAGAARPVTRSLRRLSVRPWRLLPTPTGTRFTFAYAVVLAVTSLIVTYADPAQVHALHQASSTDVAHLVRTPVLVLVASALWIAGGILSPYALGLLFVLTALERRIGGLRTAAVFLLGHVLATLATEVPIGVAVLTGHLPVSSVHRLDYGISFGVAASVGALAGLLTPWLRWPVLVVFAGMLLEDLLAFTDPMTNWGHLMSLTIGIATWPLTRHRHRTAVLARA